MAGTLRPPYAPDFYRGDCARQIEGFLEDFQPAPEPVRPVAGLVPHAGWVYSGRVAARILRNLALKRTPQTIVLLGTVHIWGVKRPSVFPAGAWKTPLGPVEVDAAFAQALVDGGNGLVQVSERAHEGEHSIEVQMPMIRHLLPEARVVPVAVPPNADATRFGELLARAVASWSAGEVVIVGTTDLTHYGENYGFAPAGRGPDAARWMHENDRRLLERAERLEAEALVPEAAAHHNACGSGAFAATVQAAKILGAPRGVVIDYTTSYDVFPRGEFSLAVGYAGMLF